MWLVYRMILQGVIVFDPSRKCVNPTVDLSPDEAEQEAKLLYYYNESSFPTAYDKRTQSSLLEGVFGFAKFCQNSTTSSTCPLIMETAKYRFIVSEVEPSIYISLIYDVLAVESACVDIFEIFKKYFYLLHGSIRDLIQNEHLDSMDDFVPCFVKSVTDVFPKFGIRYAPVERHAFVAVHSLGMELLYEFDQVDEFAIFYRGLFISSSMDPETVCPLYHYLVTTPRGTVCNTKLAEPPFGRIGTPAILPGGGSSSFGRSNAMIKENGFLFGPTGEGEGVFCPLVFLQTSAGYLCVYILNGLMFVFVLKSVSNFSVFKRIEKYLSENNEITYEILPLLNTSVVNSCGKHLWFINKVNMSIVSEEISTQYGFLWSLVKQPPSKSTMQICHPTNAIEFAYKPATNEGWHVFRNKNQREFVVRLADHKMPLWKVNGEIERLIAEKFNATYM